MIQVRISRHFAPGPESAEFALNVELTAGPGITVLFGASGSGKTLTLDCIAGFVKPDSGRILLDDEILYDGASGVNLRPQNRNCGYVFQNYALFPHMTLRDNLAFAAERQPRLERHRRVSEMLEKFELGGVAGRHPHEVSGGEKQRCSIARALIGEPGLLLLDEPARGLDAPLRAGLYSTLRQVRADFNLPILLVTHDLDECFELGDQMLVLREGRMVQSGAPNDVLTQPANVDVARLLGIPNLFQAEIAALDPAKNTSRLKLPDFELTGPYYPGRFLRDRVWLCVRAEDLRAQAANGSTPDGPNRVPVKLVRVSPRPRTVRLEFSPGITVEMSRAEFERQKDNEEWLVEFPPCSIRML
ncbi:MAG TPA: ATP-binding cassette domain-containing protein [Bryobacteraceae bacterium]|jgi:molybdate transport system ATP-binding protein|nr:ATP-binding cassette domain-containing protein [Bryobacteraceae bacterium]